MCCATTPATVLISLAEVPPLIPLWWAHLALFVWPGFNFFKPFQSAPLHSWEALQVTNSANDIQHYSRHDVCLEISSTKQLSPTNVNPTSYQGSGNEHNKPRFFGGKLPLVQSPVELFFSTRNLTRLCCPHFHQHFDPQMPHQILLQALIMGIPAFL